MVPLSLAIALLRPLRACFRSRSERALVELALGQQLAALAQAGRRPKRRPWIVPSRYRCASSGLKPPFPSHRRQPMSPDNGQRLRK